MKNNKNKQKLFMKKNLLIKRDKLESISGKGLSPKNFKFHEKVQN